MGTTAAKMLGCAETRSPISSDKAASPQNKQRKELGSKKVTTKQVFLFFKFLIRQEMVSEYLDIQKAVIQLGGFHFKSQKLKEKRWQGYLEEPSQIPSESPGEARRVKLKPSVIKDLKPIIRK